MVTSGLNDLEATQKRHCRLMATRIRIDVVQLVRLPQGPHMRPRPPGGGLGDLESIQDRLPSLSRQRGQRRHVLLEHGLQLLSAPDPP